MNNQDVEKLNELLNQYGPEKVMVFVKGYCIRKAEETRKETVPNSIFALSYELIAKSISKVLNETQKEKK